MAQVPATQQPQPVPSQGIFLTGACFCAIAGPAGIGISGIIMAHGVGPAAEGIAKLGAAPPKIKPKATSSVTIRRSIMVRIRSHNKPAVAFIQPGKTDRALGEH